ncbi:ADP-L-glycero-D-manno-heptose-6-epimerase [uncultured archaeon]|nr:ADP-L-glycero-D-manno-heptose-6-epimerase [uncultured archaeon]
MNVIVAGGSGRLGQKVLASLVRHKIPCAGLVRSKKAASKLPKGAKARVVDYNDLDSLRKALGDATHVVNCTGLVSDSAPLNELMMANALVTRHLLEACPKGIYRFVHLSSIAVYGFRPAALANEFAPRKPDTPYGRSKMEGERIAGEWAHRISVVILQPGMIYGPRFREGFWPMLDKLRAGKVRIIGDGKNVLPLVHVDDVVRGVLAALRASVPSGSTYLLVYPQIVTQREALIGAAHALKAKPPKESIPTHAAHLISHAHHAISRLRGHTPSMSHEMLLQLSSNRAFDVHRAIKLLAWRPAISFKEGLAQVIREYKKKNRGR